MNKPQKYDDGSGFVVDAVEDTDIDLSRHRRTRTEGSLPMFLSDAETDDDLDLHGNSIEKRIDDNERQRVERDAELQDVSDSAEQFPESQYASAFILETEKLSDTQPGVLAFTIDDAMSDEPSIDDDVRVANSPDHLAAPAFTLDEDGNDDLYD